MNKILISFYLILIPLICFHQCKSDQREKNNISNSSVEQELSDDVIRYNEMCDFIDNSTDADTILKYSQLAIDFAKNSGIIPTRALLNLGYGYQLSGKLALALEYLTKAAQLHSEANNTLGLANAYYYISDVYFSQQHYINANLYLNKALKIYEEVDSFRLAYALNNLGFRYYQIQKYDSALLQYSHSFRICKKLNITNVGAYCIGNSGLVYSKLNKLDIAEQNLLQAIEILSEFEDERAISAFLNEYAWVLQRKGKIGEAIKYTYIGFGLAHRNNLIEQKRDVSYRLANIYQEIERFDSALYYQQLYYAYNDSIRNLETIQQMADQRTRFEVDQKQAEVDILEKNRQLQRTIIGGLILIVFLAGGLALLIYLSLKRNRKLTKALEVQKVKLEVQSRELQELNHIKDRFFSIISHDLRSPIASLGGISYLIKEGQKTDNKAILTQATEYIDQSVVSLTGLLENLLNWALSQQGKFPFKEEQIDLKELIEEVVKIFASVTLSKNQTIDLDLASGLVVSADKNTLMTVIRNLLSNATKFTPKEGRISIKSQKDANGHAEIILSDEGVGIPEEKLDDIFKLKEDKSSRGTDNEKGLGLGLNLVHEFVTTNKGTIRVESKVGEGTSFFLNFPLILS